MWYIKYCHWLVALNRAIFNLVVYTIALIINRGMITIIIKYVIFLKKKCQI